MTYATSVRARALFVWGLASLLLRTSVACTPARPGPLAAGPGPTELERGPSLSIVDAGAMKVCTHDAKDLAPCEGDCDRGISFACTVLALRVERGDAVAKDLTRAVRLHERACELGDAGGCVIAARMHAAGTGVPPSRARQLELLVAACTLGDAQACSIPAKAFANGTGVPRDERHARELWQRACAGGLAAACAEIETPP